MDFVFSHQERAFIFCVCVVISERRGKCKYGVPSLSLRVFFAAGILMYRFFLPYMLSKTETWEFVFYQIFKALYSVSVSMKRNETAICSET
jgi:hypothetical protein